MKPIVERAWTRWDAPPWKPEVVCADDEICILMAEALSED